MPHRVSIAAGCILLSGLLWTGLLLFGSSPLGTHSSAMLAAGLLVSTAVNVVALLLSPGRWVRNSIAVVAGAWAVTAVALPVDPAWIVALVTHVTGVALTWTRRMDGWFRQVKPDRVPARATILALGLVWLPAVVGGLGIPDATPAGWVMGIFGLGVGWAYARALPGALWAVRLLPLPLGIASVFGAPWHSGAAILAVSGVITFLAWTADARLAVRPPGPRRVAAVTVLPEVAPPGIMESAGYDRRGRPLEG